MPDFNEPVRISGQGGQLAIALDGNARSIGMTNQAGRPMVRLDGNGGALFLEAASGGTGVTMLGIDASLRIGTGGHSGSIGVADGNGKSTIVLDGAKNSVVLRNGQEAEEARLMAGAGGLLQLRSTKGRVNVESLGEQARLSLGGGERDGRLYLKNAAGDTTVQIDGKLGDVTAGGGGTGGLLALKNAAGATTVQIDGQLGDLAAGGEGTDGALALKNAAGQETVRLDGAVASLGLGGNGINGDVVIRDGAGRTRVAIDAQNGSLTLQSATGAQVFRLNSNDGRFHLRNWTIEAPDYVFAPDYPLRPLGDLAEYVDANRHLPDVPSAAEIARDGVEMGALAMTLLRKVEELTLYVLRQDAEMTSIRTRLAALEHVQDA